MPNTLLQLDAQIQIALRQKLLEALQKPGLGMDQLTKLAKLYQKTIDQELKAKSQEIKMLQLAYQSEKLAADNAKEDRKQEEKLAKRAEGKPQPPVPPDGKRKPVWPEPEAVLTIVQEQKRLDALEQEQKLKRELEQEVD